jgi:hypothetical protein
MLAQHAAPEASAVARAVHGLLSALAPKLRACSTRCCLVLIALAAAAEHERRACRLTAERTRRRWSLRHQRSPLERAARVERASPRARFPRRRSQRGPLHHARNLGDYRECSTGTQTVIMLNMGASCAPVKPKRGVSCPALPATAGHRTVLLEQSRSRTTPDRSRRRTSTLAAASGSSFRIGPFRKRVLAGRQACRCGCAARSH